MEKKKGKKASIDVLATSNLSILVAPTCRPTITMIKIY
jgi:hypothetical protein